MKIEIDDVLEKYNYLDLANDLEFDFSMGSTILLCGKNGIGKSTLLKYINKKYGDQLDIFYLPQKLIRLNNITINNLVELLRTSYRFESEPEVLFKALDCDYSGNKKFKALSGGEQQKIMIAICLSVECELLLLDEPFNNLDKKSCASVSQLLTENNTNKIVVSHIHFPADSEVKL